MNTLYSSPKPESNTPLRRTNLDTHKQSVASIMAGPGTTPEMQKFVADMAQIESMLTAQELSLDRLREGIDQEWPERQVLDSFLQSAGLPCTSQNRNVVALAIRRSDVSDFSSLIDEEITRLNLVDKEAREARIRMEKSFYDSISQYYEWVQRELIQAIEREQLLTPFYRAIFHESYEIIKAFNILTPLWKKQVIDQTNAELTERFSDPTQLSAYLHNQNLIDLAADSKPVGWSYTILVPDVHWALTSDHNPVYHRMTLKGIYTNEVNVILQSLERLKDELSQYEDTLFNQQTPYLDYLEALTEALANIDPDHSISLWQAVDAAWMKITGPIQMVHPFESYLDNLRSTVGLQFDLRMSLPNAGVSLVCDAVKQMVYTVAKDFPEISQEQIALWINGLNQKTVYFVGLPIHGGEQFYGPPSAQVIPNDVKVGDEHGRKIFAFPRREFNLNQTRPLLKIRALSLSDELITQEKDLYTEERYPKFLQMYDRYINWHEFGHGLWRTSPQSKSDMNASGAFMNIEEWQATAAATVAYFGSPESEDTEGRKVFLMELITRAVGLLRYYKTNDVIPYYTESLIHLELLFAAWVVMVAPDGRMTLTHAEWGFEALAAAYGEEYRELVCAYLLEEDASIFLARTTELVDGIYLPKRPELRAFVEQYIERYKEYGLEVVE